jgi:hypothetical protein
MKRFALLLFVLALFLTAAAPVQSQTVQQVLQGTQLKLVLLTGLSTSVAREGDPFFAEISEPVMLGNQMLLPAGTRVRGEVGTILRPKRLAMFRGQAGMNLYIRSIEIDHREIPAPMSILAIYETALGGDRGKERKDLKTVEGAVVQSRRDIKGDVKTVAFGTAGGTVVGAVFSNVMRGVMIGLIGSTAYVVVKKGKEVELPAQTGLLVRLDNTVMVPTTAAAVATGTP